jgi:hypothetical protein
MVPPAYPAVLARAVALEPIKSVSGPIPILDLAAGAKESKISASKVAEAFRAVRGPHAQQGPQVDGKLPDSLLEQLPAKTADCQWPEPRIQAIERIVRAVVMILQPSVKARDSRFKIN